MSVSEAVDQLELDVLEKIPKKEFVPPALAQFGVDPIDCCITKTYCRASDKTEYKFEIRWRYDEPTKPSLRKLRKKEANVSSNSSETTKHRRSASICSKSGGDYSRTSVKSREKKQQVAASKPPDPTIRCDGPCGTSLPAQEYRPLKDCGHILCRECRSLVKNIRGKGMCCAFYCTYKHFREFLDEESAKKLYEQEIKIRQDAKKGHVLKSFAEPRFSQHNGRSTISGSATEASELSSIRSCASAATFHYGTDQVSRILSECNLITPGKEDFATEAEMISVRAVLFLRDKESNKVVRRDVSEEFPAYHTLKDVVEYFTTCTTNYPIFTGSIRVWFCPPVKNGRMQLIKNENQPLHELGAHAGRLRIIVDGAEIIVS